MIKISTCVQDVAGDMLKKLEKKFRKESPLRTTCGKVL